MITSFLCTIRVAGRHSSLILLWNLDRTSLIIVDKEEMWKKEMKRKISELVDLKVYVKPEEGKAHYVINGEITGSIDL